MEMGRGKGKQRIEMKRIVEKSRSRVTFSKRRQGLFKKAHELDILCGSQTAIVSVSDSGNVFTAGSPSLLPLLLNTSSTSRAGIIKHDIAAAAAGGLDTMGLEELGRALAAIKDIQRSVEFAMEKEAAAAAAAAAAVSGCLLPPPGPVSLPHPSPCGGDTAIISLSAGGEEEEGEDCTCGEESHQMWQLLEDIEFDERLCFEVADLLYNGSDDHHLDDAAAAANNGVDAAAANNGAAMAPWKEEELFMRVEDFNISYDPMEEEEEQKKRN